MFLKRAPAAKRWSLASRFIALYILSGFCLILFATGFLYWALVRHFDHEARELLSRKADAIRILLDEGTAGLSRLPWEVRRPSLSKIYIRITDDKGQVIATTPGIDEELDTKTLPHSPIGLDKAQGNTKSRTGDPLRLLVARHIAKTGQPYLIQILMNHSMDERFLQHHRSQLWVVLASLLLIWGLLGYLVVRNGIKPVERLAEDTLKIHSMPLSGRLDLDGLPAELVMLGNAFNGLLDRLEQSFTRLERFSADIAHELRTPLNNIRGEIEVVLRQEKPLQEYQAVMGSCLEECVRMSQMIDSLLFLARAEDPKTQIQKKPLNIKQELTIIQEFYDSMARDAGVELHLEAPDDLGMSLDRDLLQRAVGNLLDNSIRHTPSGGTVTITATPRAGAVQLGVTDTGCGIAPEHLDNVFERFFRTDSMNPTCCPGKGSCGLGLPIVKSIAALHGGTVSIRSELEKGTSVTLTFPKA